ncbi:MAG TPA: ArsA-related P-loop ATPase [Candidatus Dormibacteraeota bacterium]|nr:ArsA-related P-loop ATPase [Candidatus Dormibacteraeota bacterium]
MTERRRPRDGGAAASGGVDLAALLQDASVVVVGGSGGVGKTTVSAALATALVEHLDARILVLTVDPARRLASALGMEIGRDAVPVSAARLRRAGIVPRGELVAAMLDTKSSWDRFVERQAPSRESARRILANPFYKGISDAFTGSHEFIAMETLYELWAAKEYDIIVLDTPPSRNALDFLDAPTRMSDFVGGRLLSWLALPMRVGVRGFNFAAGPFLRIADRLLGADVVAELAQFVGEIQGMYAGVQRRAAAVYRLLRSSEAAFVVVTTLEPEPFAEAEYFSKRLREYRMPLRALVVNRVLPALLLDPAAAEVALRLSEGDRETVAALQGLAEPGTARPSVDTARRLGDAFSVLHRLAERDERQVHRLSALGRLPVARLPLAETEVGDLEGLAPLSRVLRGR